MLDSFNFYIEKYEILNNPLLIAAMFLGPRCFSFSNCTQNEKENFLKVAINNICLMFGKKISKGT